MKTIAFVVGSLRKDSYNKQLAKAVSKLLPIEYSAELVDISKLPLYNQDDDNNTSDEVVEFKKSIASSSAVVFVTPEYNRSIPGPLKNALDQGSRPYGSSTWQGKPAGVLGISPGAMGSALAQQHLRNVLAFLDMPTMNQPEVFLQYNDKLFNEAGEFAHESTKAFLQGWVDHFIEWTDKVS